MDGRLSWPTCSWLSHGGQFDALTTELCHLLTTMMHVCYCVLADLRSQLLMQEERCRTLEQQLENTRVMVHHAEHDRAEALRKMAALHTDDVHPDSAERRSYIDKISDLERDQLKLMATQTLAQVSAKFFLEVIVCIAFFVGSIAQWLGH